MEYLLAIGFKSKKSIAEKSKTIKRQIAKTFSESALVYACWRSQPRPELAPNNSAIIAIFHAIP